MLQRFGVASILVLVISSSAGATNDWEKLSRAATEAKDQSRYVVIKNDRAGFKSIKNYVDKLFSGKLRNLESAAHDMGKQFPSYKVTDGEAKHADIAKWILLLKNRIETFRKKGDLAFTVTKKSLKDLKEALDLLDRSTGELSRDLIKSVNAKIKEFDEDIGAIYSFVEAFRRDLVAIAAVIKEADRKREEKQKKELAEEQAFDAGLDKFDATIHGLRRKTRLQRMKFRTEVRKGRSNSKTANDIVREIGRLNNEVEKHQQQRKKYFTDYWVKNQTETLAADERMEQVGRFRDTFKEDVFKP